MNVILTAGMATRMGDAAPHGCKALVEFRGRPMIEWQFDVLGEATIVCRSEHVPYLQHYGPLVTDDTGFGPAHALLRATRATVGESTTVVYADSFFTALPAGEAWCATNYAWGPRLWDVVTGSHVYSLYVGEHERLEVCTGMYRFPDREPLVARLRRLYDGMGLGPAVNATELPFVLVESWKDVGTAEALAAAR